MAQADAELDSVEVGQVECNGSGALQEPPANHGSGTHVQHTTCNGSGPPYMPHLALAQEELDRLHPNLVPPDDEQLDDLANDANDVVYQKGLQLAEEIRDETSLQGRMRRPMLARVQEQQQGQDESSELNRTRTIRPFGGGVISTATALVPLLHLTTTTTTTNYTTTATTTAGRVDDGIGGGDGRGACKAEGNEARGDGQMKVARLPLNRARTFSQGLANYLLVCCRA